MCSRFDMQYLKLKERKMLSCQEILLLFWFHLVFFVFFFFLFCSQQEAEKTEALILPSFCSCYMPLSRFWHMETLWRSILQVALWPTSCSVPVNSFAFLGPQIKPGGLVFNSTPDNVAWIVPNCLYGKLRTIQSMWPEREMKSNTPGLTLQPPFWNWHRHLPIISETHFFPYTTHKWCPPLWAQG